jgi:hypothetical protein
MEGITAAVIGALVGSVIIIALRSIVDIPTALIAVAAVLALLYIRYCCNSGLINQSSIIYWSLICLDFYSTSLFLFIFNNFFDNL